MPVKGEPYTPCSTNTKYSPAFIGNPYPSMLDADSFLSNASNVANLSGAIYLWTHNTAPSNSIPGDATYNYTANDFVIYNLVGGIGTGRVTGQPIYAPNNYNRPNGKIAMCQGFITRGINANGFATFTNDMRDYSLDDPLLVDNQQFFRVSGVTTPPPTSKNRFWVSLEGAAGAGSSYKETLIGYMPSTSAIAGSTNGYEKSYDTEIYYPEASSSFKIYTILNSTTTCPKLLIQGRKLDATFNNNDVVPLGYTCPAGSWKIKLEGTEGIFGTQLIWLREQTSLGVYQYYDDIRTIGHLFTSTGDTDNTTRFQIVFSLPGVININSPLCGTTITSINNTFFFNPVAGVTSYHIMAVPPLGSGLPTIEFNTSVPRFQMTQSGLNYNTTYQIFVATYQVGSQWIYGNIPCTATMPATPSPSFISGPTCGSTLLGTWDTIFAQEINGLGINPTNYQFTITVGATVYPPFVTPNRTFQLPQVPGLPITANTTYIIKVDVLWNTILIPGIINCSLTTPNVIPRYSENNLSIFEASAYPNPFTNNFKIALNTSSEEKISIKAYDMLGRMVEAKEASIADFDSQEIGNQFTSGVYNIIVTQGDNVKSLRVVKR